MKELRSCSSQPRRIHPRLILFCSIDRTMPINRMVQQSVVMSNRATNVLLAQLNSDLKHVVSARKQDKNDRF